MPFRPLAALLLVFAASAAPWMAGANTTLPLAGWWLGVPLTAAFGFIICDRIQARAWLRMKWPALVAVLFLSGCIVGWTVSPAPGFTTAFGEEHWQFLETQFPFVMLHWPRLGRLLFLMGLLLGFLAAVELGVSEDFRRDLRATVGLTGLLLAIYALGIRWLGWSAPPWLELSGDTERFNVSFFHHNAPGACLNLAWPLLLFARTRLHSARLNLVIGSVLLLVVGAALPLWHSYSAPLVAFGLLVLGVAWRKLGTKTREWPWLVRGTMAALFTGIFAWQAVSVVKMRVAHPDGWTSAAQTIRDAPTRDAAFKAAANLRGDRLVASSAPPRPAAWLTALRMAKDHPLVGLGPGSWVTHAVLYSNDSLVNTFYQHRQFAHHDLLQTAAEWGGLGAAAWLVIWIGAFWVVSQRDAKDPSREMDLVLALLGIALHSTVHFPLQNPALLLWTTLLLGLAWSEAPHARENSAPHQSEKPPPTP
ncbi:MAG: O-antigen ligase family protein [Opitutaceae bacterium]